VLLVLLDLHFLKGWFLVLVFGDEVVFDVHFASFVADDSDGFECEISVADEFLEVAFLVVLRLWVCLFERGGAGVGGGGGVVDGGFVGGGFLSCFGLFGGRRGSVVLGLLLFFVFHEGVEEGNLFHEAGKIRYKLKVLIELTERTPSS
jgi:hypothetical protein